MFTKRFFALCALFLGWCFFARAQSSPIRTDLIPASPTAGSIVKAGETPVNLSSGLPSVSVPIYTVGGQELSLPISLNYSYGGYRPAQAASWVGRGWNLEAGGVITRTVRDKVDGTMGNGNYDGAYVQSVLNAGAPYPQNFLRDAALLYDLELDLYSFSFPGYSGKFVQYNGKYYMFPSQKLKIVGSGSGFTITTENGTKYKFYQIETTNPKASNIGGYNLPSSYNSSFYLTTIENAQGTEKIHLNYTSEGPVSSSGPPVQTYKRVISSVTSSFPSALQTAFPTKVNTVRLSSITSEKSSVNFVAGGLRTDINQSDGGYASSLAQIQVYANGDGLVKKFQLSQSYNGQLQLDSIKECPVPFTGALATSDTLTHKFEYMPAASFTGGHRAWVDHYGFYTGLGEFNGMIIPSTFYSSGANREPSFAGTVQGAMTKVTYPSGGHTIFNYEQNNKSGGCCQVDGVGSTASISRPPGGSSTVSSGLSFTLPSQQTVSILLSRTPYQEQADGNARNQIDDIVIEDASFNIVFSARIGLESQNSGMNYSVMLPAGTYTIRVYADFRESLVWASYGYGVVSNRPLPNINVGGIRLSSMETYPLAGTPMIRQFNYNHPSGSSSGGGPMPAYQIRPFTDIYVPPGSAWTSEVSDIYSSAIGDAPSNELPHWYTSVLEKRIAPGDTVYARHQFTNFLGSFAGNGPQKITEYRRTGNTITPTMVKTFDYGYVPADSSFNFIKPYQIRQVHLNGGYWDPNDMTEHAYDVSSDGSGGFKYLRSTRQVNYEGTDSLVSVTSHNYDPKFNLAFTTSNNSKGEVLVSKFKYPENYASGFSAMLASNVLSPVIEQQLWNRTGTDSVLVSGNLTEYSQTSFKPLKVYQLHADGLTALNNESKSGALYNNFLSDTRYEEKAAFSYDAKDRLVSQQLKYGAPISYKWGYPSATYPAANTGEMDFPVAEIKNALPAEVYFENFESQSSATSGGGNSGEKYHSGDLTLGFTPPNSKSYKLNYFYRNAGKWMYKSVAYTGPVTITDGDAVDDVAILPVDAELSSVSYYPGIGNRMSINARGNRASFEYDGLGRPVNIKDDNGDVTKNFSYNQGKANGLYYNTAQSAIFTRNNCSTGQMGSSVIYTVAANTYSSTVSQAAADAAAMAQVTANGQAHTNAVGTCSPAVAISYINDTFSPFDGTITQLRVKDAQGNVLYTFNESQLIAGISIPQGTYTLGFTIVNLSQHSWGTCMIYSSSGYNEFYSTGTTNYEVPGVVMTGTTATIYLSSYS